MASNYHPTFVGIGQVLTVKSPLSSSIILSYDGTTKETLPGFCQECYDVVKGIRIFSQKSPTCMTSPFFDNGVGDPIYFLGAGVEFNTLILPARWGRIAWEKGNKQAEDVVRSMISSLPKTVRKQWGEKTGNHFPHWLYK